MGAVGERRGEGEGGWRVGVVGEWHEYLPIILHPDGTCA